MVVLPSQQIHMYIMVHTYMFMYIHEYGETLLTRPFFYFSVCVYLLVFTCLLCRRVEEAFDMCQQF